MSAVSFMGEGEQEEGSKDEGKNLTLTLLSTKGKLNKLKARTGSRQQIGPARAR